jgi:hypothetical protein
MQKRMRTSFRSVAKRRGTSPKLQNDIRQIIDKLPYETLLSISPVVNACSLEQAKYITQKLCGNRGLIARRILVKTKDMASLSAYSKMVNSRLSSLNRAATKNVDVSRELKELGL